MLIKASALHLPMKDRSVHCVVTSPPYWGLRDYSACLCVEHRVKDATSTLTGSAEGTSNHSGKPDPDCKICNGTGRTDMDQIGMESTPEEYIAKLMDVFREVWRVLMPTGTLWLNLGDSYATDIKGHGSASRKQLSNAGSRYQLRRFHHGMKQKDLVGIPWRTALALQAEGWYLRSDIIWAKPNPMPESVRDRPTKSHEYLFLLSKQPMYYYDQDAIRERFADARMGNPGAYRWAYANDPETGKGIRGSGGPSEKMQREGWNSDRAIEGRNKRSVWMIPTNAHAHAHFATFPARLVKPCILAGTSSKGCCPECLAPWISKKEVIEDHDGPEMKISWDPSCRCGHLHTQPCLVFDPFCGSGTTIRVAAQLNRRGVGVDLAYQDIAKRRISNIQRDLQGFEEEWISQ